MVNVLDVVESNISPLRDRVATRNSPSNVLQVLEGCRQPGVDQIGIQRAVRHVREVCHWQLLVVGGVRHDAESAGLRETCGGARVGAEAEPEALEVEGLDAGAGAGDGLGVGVEGELAELKEVEGTSGSGLLRFGVRGYGGEAFNRALLGVVREGSCWCSFGVMGTYEDDDAAPAEAVVQANREELGD